MLAQVLSERVRCKSIEGFHLCRYQQAHSQVPSETTAIRLLARDLSFFEQRSALISLFAILTFT